MLFVYAREGGLNVYEAASGKRIATLPCGPGHWNSPIVLQGQDHPSRRQRERSRHKRRAGYLEPAKPALVA